MRCSQVSAGSAQLGKRDSRSHMYLRYMYSGFADIIGHHKVLANFKHHREFLYTGVAR
ncbi:hypothetical protein M413DRAFT_191294 [Hebeloma cylindrosporum]|uniref:Uncharacterized protein n=1 Tax=Hebeloma cylindrosporum TaxID=76867 RepID=A0A0C3BRW5_HEBCY|nr:hypothetical protein M413DRAFT_191294 [Hebeloma cylindrosporum h7]